MNKQWTSSQKNAIDAQGNTLVSASAGTGKTAVLTERVVSTIMTKKVSIDNLLIMTFSNAAATEMQERIKSKLFEILLSSESSSEQKSLAYAQIQKMPSAKIQTIHAFCNEIVKEFFYRTGLDANIRTASAMEILMMKKDAMDEVLKSEYQNKSLEFSALEEYIDGMKNLEDTLMTCYEKIMSFTDPFAWLHQAVEQYQIEDNSLPEYLSQMIIHDLQDAVRHLDIALIDLRGRDEPKLQKNIQSIADDREIICSAVDALKQKDIHALDADILSGLFPTIRFSSKDGDFENVKAHRNAAKDIMAMYMGEDYSLSNQIDRINWMYMTAKKFEDILIRFHETYIQKKRMRKLIDFNDMEKYAYQILQDNNIANMIANRFTQIFVDEYQDTNPIQEAIINKIAIFNNLFCVGDLKQSIYRFRASDPLLFAHRSEQYRLDSSKGTVIALNKNFRSSQNILDCANDVFNCITEASSEIQYTDDDSLIHGRDDDHSCNPVTIQFLPEELSTLYPGATKEEIEIYHIAHTIQEIVGTDIFDQEKNEVRKAEYGDIAILSRQLTGISDSFAQIMTANHIPFKIEKSGDLMKSVEIEILFHLIDLVHVPDDDIKLMALIHERFFDFEDNDLILIRKHNPQQSFYQNMMELSQTETTTGMKCRAMFDFFASVREKENNMSLTALLDDMLGTIHYYDHFATMQNPEKRISNIKLICSYASEYEEKYADKLVGFSSYMKQADRISLEDAKMHFHDNCVTITTIHKSKGLEFPVVILPFMNKGFSTIDKTSNIIIDKDAGLGFRYFDNISADNKSKGKNLLRTYIERVTQRKSIEEEMRLLYVAMTRAKERLFIQGFGDAYSDYSLENAGSMMDWIMTTMTRGTMTDGHTVQLNGVWQIQAVDAQTIADSFASESHPVSNEDFLNQYAGAGIKEIQEVFEKPIPIPAVISSSHLENIHSLDFSIPEFDEDNFSSSDIGTITHTFMRHLQFKGDVSETGLQDQLSSMVERNILTPEEAVFVRIDKIAAFFATEFGKKMISADEYITELSVCAVKSAKELGISESEEEVLIRGVIDMIFRIGDHYYIVDYKTDHFHDPSELQTKAKRHEKQIQLYREIFSEVYNKSVESIALIFFDIAETVVLS